MSRTSFTRRFSFNSGRKNSRDNKQHPNACKGEQRQPPPSASTLPSHHPHHPSDSHPHHPHPHPHHHHHNSLQDKRQHSRRENSDMEKVARGIFGDVPLTDTERRFLSSAETGHLAALEQCVEDNGNLNVNCRDYLSRTALQLAVLGEHYDCISYLLQKSSWDTIEEALLHAIKAENVKICDMVLSHPLYSDQTVRLQLEARLGVLTAAEQEDTSSSFAPDITPVVLAAQCNNFDIVHMLIQKGFIIQRPHHYFCFCEECTSHKTLDRFVHSRSRLNAYRGLASTAYLSLSCDDPILTAFELSKSLHSLAETEKEYKSKRQMIVGRMGRGADYLDDAERLLVWDGSATEMGIVITRSGYRGEFAGVSLLTRLGSGDVEANPGPNPEPSTSRPSASLRQTRISTPRKSSQSAKDPSLSEVMATLNSINSSLNDKMDGMNASLNGKMDGVKEDVGQLHQEFGTLSELCL
ncbi:hypothetical protein ACOMHN_059894 [Nucella lapillus]